MMNILARARVYVTNIIPIPDIQRKPEINVRLYKLAAVFAIPSPISRKPLF